LGRAHGVRVSFEQFAADLPGGRAPCNTGLPRSTSVPVTPPRCIQKGQLCFVTVQAVNRSFRFVPTRKTCALIWYCYAVALQNFGSRIAMHDFLVMSNHYHLVLSDLGGCLPDFIAELNSVMSRTLNAMRGISGANIEEGYCLVAVEGDEKLIEHCVYTLANPCASDLVARSRQWKGVSSLGLEYGETVQVPRPELGLWAGKQQHVTKSNAKRSKRAARASRSKLPKVAEFQLVRPPVMLELSDAQLRAFIREKLDERELDLMRTRKRKGIGVLGWNRVVEQHFLAIPSRSREMFGTVPSFSASSTWKRVEAAQRRKSFIDAYRAALETFIGGARDVLFPAGTWLMRRRYGCQCCPSPV
jgi:putative transposase